MITISRRFALLLLLLSTLVSAACAARNNNQLPTAASPVTLDVTAAISQAPSATPAPVQTATLLAPTETATATVTPTQLPTETPEPTPCAQPGRVENATFSSTTAGGEHRYNIYLPPCYGVDGNTYPVLYLLAGNIHDEGKWAELGIDAAAESAISAGQAPPVIIVMPDGGWIANNTSGGPGSYETLIRDELIPHVETTYCAWADPAGRALGGLSRGGYWALEIAFRSPELFVSAGGHSAALLDSFAGPAINPQHTALINDLGDLRIYLDIGANDYVRANTIKLHEDMQNAGVAHEWHLNEGEHVDEYWASHASDYLAWYVAPWTDDRGAYPPCSNVSSAP